MISKEALEDFKKIWREQFGEDISDEKATEELRKEKEQPSVKITEPVEESEPAMGGESIEIVKPVEPVGPTETLELAFFVLDDDPADVPLVDDLPHPGQQLLTADLVLHYLRPDFHRALLQVWRSPHQNRTGAVKRPGNRREECVQACTTSSPSERSS